MRDLGGLGGGSGSPAALPGHAEITTFAARLAGSGAGLDDAERIDAIRALEVLKCAAEGAQAALSADFDASQRAKAAAVGEPAARQGRGIAAQVALARRESPRRGQVHLGLAKVLRDEMPHTRRALREGRITEWRATLMARETACLALEQRRDVDERLAGGPERLERLEQMGDRELVSAVRDLACRLDPASVAERRRRAEQDRHTTLRPAPDTMTWFGALLPVKDGVAVHKALLDEADRRKAAGDTRSRGAIMADTLVRRVLQPHVAGDGGLDVPLTINVVLPGELLLGDREGSGWVEEYGEVPGELLRDWIATNAEHGVRDWVNRLYQSPATGELVAMDRQGRYFDGRLAEFIRLRDRRCRELYCDALVRHIDHAVDHADGGRTSARNAQGTCAACNYAKQARGWSARPRPGPQHVIETITPTGHRYLSYAPAVGAGLRMEIYPITIRVG
jgi:hypothetical protein